jgi:hypothetical protein|tara:strand:- start:147 stop:350 length:204 start_codon:yes stop_codon:yes gene_type:complete
LKQKDNLEEVIKIMTNVKSLVQKNENILTDYEEQSNRLKLTKQIRELENIRRLEEEENQRQESRKNK